MRRRLDLGATLIGEPSLLLMDEPTVGLDPRSRLAIWRVVERIADRGAGVLVTSQNLDEVDTLGDRVVVRAEGSVIADDSVEGFRRRIVGRVLGVRAVDAGASDVAARTMTALRLDVRTDGGRAAVSAPTDSGLTDLARIASALADGEVNTVEVALRTPSLEEVFLQLTDDTPTPSGTRPRTRFRPHGWVTSSGVRRPGRRCATPRW